MIRPLTFKGRLPGVVCETALPPRENPLRLDVAAFVGFAERGPLDTPIAVEDIGQYHAVFGGDLPLARYRQGSQIAYANLPRAVQAFFDNGGRRCYVVRVAGKGGRSNYFRIPGLLTWDATTETLQPVIVPAAWVGRWSVAMGVGTQLLSQPLRVAKGLVEWGHDDIAIHLEVPAVSVVQANDLLRLRFAGPGKPILFALANKVAKEGEAITTVRGVPVEVSAQRNNVQSFTANIQPLPLPVAAGVQKKDTCERFDALLLALEELPGLVDGYVLRMETSIEVKPRDVLCIDCLDGEELLFPVETVDQRLDAVASPPDHMSYALTSRTPTWKLTPTRAACLKGSGWKDINMYLSALSLEVRMGSNRRECILHIMDELDAQGIHAGDALRITCMNGSELLFPVSNVVIPLPSAQASPPTSPPEAADAQLISQEALWLVAPSSPPVGYASPPLSTYEELAEVDLLTFNLYVREGETIVETWNDLRFGKGPNYWLDVLAPLPSDLQYEIAHPGEAKHGIPGLDAARSARIGAPVPSVATDDSSPVTPVYFPLSMSDLPGPDEFAGILPDADSPQPDDPRDLNFGKNGLDTFDNPADLFLDPRLAEFGYRDLLNEADAILYLSPDPQVDPLVKLHSLLLVDEIGLIALPDLPQRWWGFPGWSPPPPVQPPPGAQPPPDWSQFQVCAQPPPQEPQEETVVPPGEPELDLPIIETPDEYRPEELRALMDVQHALVNFCAARADVVGILSLPLHFKRREVVGWQEKFTGMPEFLDGVPLSYSAVYHPWLQVHEEEPSAQVLLRNVPPDGAVCGMIAARELARGPWIAPANVPLLGVVGLNPALATADWVALFNGQVNVVRQQPGTFTLMSAHTLSLEGTFLQISVRRLLIFLRKLALLRGMRYVFEPNNERFRESVQTSFELTLRTMAERGAITAFEVVTGSEINTQNDYDNGRFLIELKVAPTIPIEFITIVLLRVGEDLLEVIER
jgi:Phage tail sheath C-terminal domain